MQSVPRDNAPRLLGVTIYIGSKITQHNANECTLETIKCIQVPNTGCPQQSDCFLFLRQLARQSALQFDSSEFVTFGIRTVYLSRNYQNLYEQHSLMSDVFYDAEHVDRCGLVGLIE